MLTVTVTVWRRRRQLLIDVERRARILKPYPPCPQICSPLRETVERPRQSKPCLVAEIEDITTRIRAYGQPGVVSHSCDRVGTLHFYLTGTGRPE